MGFASLIVAVAALILYLVSLVPFLGWLSIIVIALSIVGIVLGVQGRRETGASRSTGTIGLIASIIILVAGIIRLF